MRTAAKHLQWLTHTYWTRQKNRHETPLKHGVYWETEVMRSALSMPNENYHSPQTLNQVHYVKFLSATVWKIIHD